MVRLLGRISDKRIFFEDSKTLIDHGTTWVVVFATGGSPREIPTAFKSIIFPWLSFRRAGTEAHTSVAWVVGTGGATFSITATVGFTGTVDWFAIGYTA
jgi:hypothetical protein